MLGLGNAGYARQSIFVLFYLQSVAAAGEERDAMKHQNPGFVSDEGDETEDDFPTLPQAAAVVAGGTPRQHELETEENQVARGDTPGDSSALVPQPPIGVQSALSAEKETDRSPLKDERDS